MMVDVMPDTIMAVRDYLRGLDDLTELGGRVYYGALPANPIFPAVRISDISTTEDVRHRWSRSLLQLDVWGSDGAQRDCRALAEQIRAALVSSTGHTAGNWTLGGPDNLTGVSMTPFANGFDDSFRPARPRYVIEVGMLIRPN